MIPNWAKYKVKFYLSTCYVAVEDDEYGAFYRVTGINFLHTLMFEICYTLHIMLVEPFYPDEPLPFKILEEL
jgi:uncharacterized membrane protein YjgN (DUF898 family)